MGSFGSKAPAGLCRTLIALMPPHDVDIESHSGRCVDDARVADPVLDALVCNHPLELVHGCAHAFLSSFPFSGRELVYSDPPYLQTTRRSARRYRFDSTEADPVALPDRLKQLPCQVMVSGHASALYDAMLAGWCRLALQVVTQGVVRAVVVSWSCGSPSRPTGCTARAEPGATSPTASASSARRPTGAVALRRCRQANVLRCYPP